MFVLRGLTGQLTGKPFKLANCLVNQQSSQSHQVSSLVPDLSFDAFQEGGLTLKGTRRRDAEAADVPVSVVEGVAMASLYG